MDVGTDRGGRGGSNAASRGARLATSFMFGYVDAALNRAEQVYEAEREIWLRNTAAARTDAIDDILTLRERDQQRASKRLRYEVNRQHVGAIAWVDSVPGDRDAQRSLMRRSPSLPARWAASQPSFTR